MKQVKYQPLTPRSSPIEPPSHPRKLDPASGAQHGSLEGAIALQSPRR
jgi:hypothetical protein